MKVLFRLSLVLYPFLLAISKLILGIFTPSVFLCFYALYDIGIGLAKIVDIANKHKKYSEETNFCAYIIGWFLFSSSLLFMAYSLRVFFSSKSIKYSFPIAILISVSTFILLISVIIRFIRYKKNNDIISKTIRLFNLSNVIISMAVTREALLMITLKENTLHSACLAGLIFGGFSTIISP